MKGLIMIEIGLAHYLAIAAILFTLVSSAFF